MNLRFNINLTVYCTALCLAWMVISGCARVDNADKTKVQHLFEHLDSCSFVGEGIPPPLATPQINLGDIPCFELISDENLYYQKKKSDSTRNIKNCFLVLEGGIFYVGDVPDINDICYWHPEACNSKSEFNFPDQFQFLEKNTRTFWYLVSKDMRIYDQSRSAYEWYCKLAPFPCVDSTFLDNVKGESIEVICFHDYTHCYMIGADSIPRYIDQVKSVQ